MSFPEAIQSGYQNYFNFRGRATRSEFWWFWLFYLLVIFVGVLLYPSSDVVFAVLILVNILPMLAVPARRLHDSGRSAWWLLVGLVPIAQWILLFFYAQPTGPDNRWGSGSSSALNEAEAALHARVSSGEIPQALSALELARLEFARTGKRRVFACGRCGKGISLAWKRCDHCKATFDEFPPRDTGQVV